MNTLLDILMNWSPLIWLVLILIISSKYIEFWYEIFHVCCNIFFWIYIGIYLNLLIRGYGKIIMGIISIIILCVFLVVQSCLLIKKGLKKDNLFWLILNIFYCIASIIICYWRMRFENILEIELIDELFYKLMKLDYVQFINDIVENKWFEEITIGVISAVIAGLLLERIKKNK